ncbi:O-antigen/teichoic acid export membrane protein [Sphaerotilus mobilis]|uniref:O-antigen/teichoic acid export membrane protein n=2 Tax=Sphaerotilus mobilis TaxID=47994 RepID=A0A4Q7LBG0_9BURK|nr:O-antigen/teichoic acid export membrane protein [Sphaerotilus mobilis]
MLAAALVIVGIAAAVAQLGFASSIVYHRGGPFQHNFRSTFLIGLGAVVCVAGPLAWIGVTTLFESRLQPQVYTVAGLATLTAAFAYLTTLSQISADLKVFNLLRNAVALMMLICVSAVMLLENGIAQYDWVLNLQITVTGLATLAAAFWIWKAMTEGRQVATDYKAIKFSAVAIYAGHQHITALIGVLLSNIDKIVILEIGRPDEVGFYALAFALSRQIAMVQDSVSISLFSRYAGKDNSTLSENVLKAFRTTFMPMLIVSTLAALASPWMIPTIFGSAFAACALPFSILAFEAVIGAGSWTLAQRFNAGGRPGLVALRQVTSLLPVFIGIFFLPEQDESSYLASLMLLGSFTRLLATILIYPLVLKEPPPRLLPTKQDLLSIQSFVRHRLSRSGLQ